MPLRLRIPEKNCRSRWLMVMGFGDQAPNERPGEDGLPLTGQSRLICCRV